MRIASCAVKRYDAVIANTFTANDPNDAVGVYPWNPLYHRLMTKMLENAVARLQTSDMQDQAARLLLADVGEEEPVIELTPAEEADLIEAQAEMARGEFATDAEVAAVLAKYRA